MGWFLSSLPAEAARAPGWSQPGKFPMRAVTKGCGWRDWTDARFWLMPQPLSARPRHKELHERGEWKGGEGENEKINRD